MSGIIATQKIYGDVGASYEYGIILELRIDSCVLRGRVPQNRQAEILKAAGITEIRQEITTVKLVKVDENGFIPSTFKR